MYNIPDENTTLLSAIQFKLTPHTGPDSEQRLEMKKNKHSVNVHHVIQVYTC